MTTDQVAVGDAISRIVMMWIAFIVALSLTVGMLAFLVHCILRHEDASAQIIVGLLNSFLLALDLVIYKSLFKKG